MENEEQREFIESGLCNLKLLGVPGGGKTRCIIEHAMRNLERGSYLSSNEFMILTFSRNAKLDFVRKGTGRVFKKKKCFHDMNVRTIHSFALYIMNNILGTRVTSKNESVNLYVLKAIDLLRNNPFNINDFPKYRNLRMIYVDEAQDISSIQFEFITLLQSLFRTYLTLIGDPNQNIYQFQGGSDRHLLDYRADKTVQLITNYRTHPSILPIYTAIAPHPVTMRGVERDSNEELHRDSSRVRVFRGSVEEMISDLVREVTRLRASGVSIAVIGSVKKSSPSNTKWFANMGLSLVQNALAEKNIAHQQLFSTEGGSSMKSELRQLDYAKIHLHTIHTSKGLEYDHTFVINFHHNTFTRPPTPQEFEDHHYLWYVALTRCRHGMTLYVMEDKIPFHALSRCDHSLLHFNRPLTLVEDAQKLPFSNDVEMNFVSLDYVMKKVARSPVEEKQMRELMAVQEVSDEETCVVGAPKLVNFDEYPQLYKNLFEFLYKHHYRVLHDAAYTISSNQTLVLLRDKYTNSIAVPPRLNKAYREAVAIYAPIKTDAFRFANFKALYERFNRHVKDFYRFVLECMEQRGISPHSDPIIFLYMENSVQDTDFDVPLCHIEAILSSDNDVSVRDAFMLFLFEYQFRNEKKFMMRGDYAEHVRCAEVFSEELKARAASDREGLFRGSSEVTFDVTCDNCYIDILSKTDAVVDDTHITISFHHGNDYLYCVRAFLGALLYSLHQQTRNNARSCRIPSRVLLYNLHSNRRYLVTALNGADAFMDALFALSEVSEQMIHDVTVLYDLETTGRDAESCDITEAYFHVATFDVPLIATTLVRTTLRGARVRVTDEIRDLTGITNEELEEKGVTCEEFVAKLRRCYACMARSCEFSAYNGVAFDHRILARYFPDFKLFHCTDALATIRAHYLSTRDIWNDRKLKNVHKLICGDAINNNYTAHRAKADVLMLRDIYHELRI